MAVWNFESPFMGWGLNDWLLLVKWGEGWLLVCWLSRCCVWGAFKSLTRRVIYYQAGVGRRRPTWRWLSWAAQRPTCPPWPPAPPPGTSWWRPPASSPFSGISWPGATPQPLARPNSSILRCTTKTIIIYSTSTFLIFFPPTESLARNRDSDPYSFDRSGSNPDPGFLWPKIEKIYSWNFLYIKNYSTIYLSLGLNKSHPSYKRSFQLSKENIQHFKTWNF